MGKRFKAMLPQHMDFISRQQIFFVGSAPLSGEGHVNLSPKGYDSLRILSENEAVYLDLTGSGNETAAHLNENGRITLMFAAFEGQPLILRLYGKGRVVLPGTEEYESLEGRFPRLQGARQMIYVTVNEVQTSCGYGVPLFQYEGERDTLIQWAENKGEAGLHEYRRQKNAVSLDGLPAPQGEQG
ncbi:pyridoxamine 5'-phosphate oxidase family protein [Fontibacillus sp. BL9]|uniref:pyridoxamine 5'-phosphate oxidase family protein n=1 Tax=Fontibacillus sp. BL9 TaxID=3389971 RepID=UPI00397DF6AE